MIMALPSGRGAVDDPVGDGFADADTGDAFDDVVQAFEVLDVEGGEDVDPGMSEGADDADRQLQGERGTSQVDPEVADLAGGVLSEAADQRDRDRDTGRGLHEVVGSETCHLAEVTHRHFRHVALPVGVRGE